MWMSFLSQRLSHELPSVLALRCSAVARLDSNQFSFKGADSGLRLYLWFHRVTSNGFMPLTKAAKNPFQQLPGFET